MFSCCRKIRQKKVTFQTPTNQYLPILPDTWLSFLLTPRTDEPSSNKNIHTL